MTSLKDRLYLLSELDAKLREQKDRQREAIESTSILHSDFESIVELKINQGRIEGMQLALDFLRRRTAL